MNLKRITYLLKTPRSQLTREEKRLQTIIKRYGSVSEALSTRDRSDLILGGYNAGIKKGKKGFATWQKEELRSYAKSRHRDARGRFVGEADGAEVPSKEKES